MTRRREERGVTLVEMLVAVLITLIVFAATMTVLDVFAKDNRTDQARNEVQDNARSAIDRMSLDLRNVASPLAGSAGALEKAGSYDLVFQTVSANQTFGGQNATNQMRVRYCVNTSNPSNETLYLQTQTWTTASAPAIPDTSSCPGTVASGAWSTQYTLVSNMTNEINGQNRPVFKYGPCGSSCSGTSAIKSVEADMFLDPNPNHPPGEKEITTGIAFRNSLTPPVASFTVVPVNGIEQLNGSPSSDPNGQSLSYQWYLNGSAISGATSQSYNTASLNLPPATSETFGLTVTNTGGLSNSTSQTVVTPS